MVTVSFVVGMLRLAYDEHWASDVMIGWADGFLLATCFRPRCTSASATDRRPRKSPSAVRLSVMPRAFPGGAGIGLVGELQ